MSIALSDKHAMGTGAVVSRHPRLAVQRDTSAFKGTVGQCNIGRKISDFLHMACCSIRSVHGAYAHIMQTVACQD